MGDIFVKDNFKVANGDYSPFTPPYKSLRFDVVEVLLVVVEWPCCHGFNFPSGWFGLLLLWMKWNNGHWEAAQTANESLIGLINYVSGGEKICTHVTVVT